LGWPTSRFNRNLGGTADVDPSPGAVCRSQRPHRALAGATGRVSLALAWASGRHGPGMPWLQAAAGQADRQPLSRASTAGSGTRPVLETTTGITTTDRRAHRATGAAGRRSGITRAWLAGPSIRPGARPGGRRARRDRRPRSNAVGPRGAVTAVEPGPYVLPPFPRTGAAAMAGWP
jgi:hypothetical protein